MEFQMMKKKSLSYFDDKPIPSLYYLPISILQTDISNT